VCDIAQHSIELKLHCFTRITATFL